MTLLRDLADLMFAHALLPETLALIDEQNEAQRQSGLSDVEATRATRMASVVLSGSGAEDGLLLALVKERDLDACLWSAVRFALAGGPVPGHRWFAAVLPRLKDYPHWVEARVTAITAEALLETGRRSEVQGLVGNFDASLPSDFPADQTAISVIRARLAEETGDFNRALQLYGQAENGEGAAAIDARLRRLTLEWRTGHQSLASVILGLEHLRYDWHGDATAWQVMLTLASAYREYGAPIESGFVLLSLLEQTTDDLWQRVAREALNELVHGLLVVSQQQADIDEAELLSIIDFSEASRPFWDPGLIGRDLVRNYGRFLRNAGLAGHAARMLEEYRETVSPAEARSLSADQAEMWIAARQPEQALDVLTTSKASMDRRHFGILRAKALQQLGRETEARAELAALGALGFDVPKSLLWLLGDWSAYVDEGRSSDPTRDEVRYRRCLSRFLHRQETGKTTRNNGPSAQNCAAIPAIDSHWKPQAPDQGGAIAASRLPDSAALHRLIDDALPRVMTGGGGDLFQDRAMAAGN
ncbi:hypothetical protein GCM10007972_23750 [Iodidimonas muriae]|uniref:Uncharacterized protein n=1 Tax=Iodidimonas muriae TaxID=261467 RepID=A0ABQ2LFD1_9PROT|nr:hypothetical protein GCM10007972_23750 [Iodidimonas muriae]